MKKYKKAEIVAKNLSTGSYAAGCPSMRRQMGSHTGDATCSQCEMAY